MKPEDLTRLLQEATRSGLKSVVLYGSAAAGDYVTRRSDFNLLVVTERLGIGELKALSRPAVAWVKAGNPPPLLFTLDRLRKSADVFPIELLDIRDCHKILYGEDVISELQVSDGNLRLQVEHELKSSLIKLRERYLLTQGKAAEAVSLMVESLSTFLVLQRAALRLYESPVPVVKIEALQALTQHIHFDSQVFVTIDEIRKGERKATEVDADVLMERYLQAIETVIDAIDRKQTSFE